MQFFFQAYRVRTAIIFSILTRVGMDVILGGYLTPQSHAEPQHTQASVGVLRRLFDRRRFLCRRPLSPQRRLCHHSQWRSKALRGPGSTVTLGPPSPFPLHSPPSPSPPLSLLFPSPALPLPLSGPQIPLGGLGERCKLPAGSGVEPQPKSNLVHFGLKIRHLVATILMIFLRVLPKKNLRGPLLGGPRSSGAPVH